MTDANPLLRAALDYAAGGWAIFPLKPRDKRPATIHGVKDATTDPAKIKAWWAKMPAANIGLDCARSGVVVVDLDVKENKDGPAAWAALVERQQLQAATYTSLTGGGGRHLLFRAPDGVDIPNSADKLAPGVDVRGQGGYIVLPPSIHPSGAAYQWDEAAPQALNPLPEPLIESLLSQPDPWQLFTLTDAFIPRPPVQWLVKDVLEAGTLSIWYGAPGTLKSMVLADLCVCVAAGRPWLDPAKGSGGMETLPAPVLWIDLDNGARRTHERFDALAKARNLPPTTPLYYTAFPDPPLDAGDREAISQLAERIVRLNIGLVVIDNLGKVSGNADENSAEMQKPMGGLRWLVEATGVTLAVLHHQRKSNGTAGRDGDTLRGHGSIEAAIDLALLVKRDENNISLVPTKVRGKELRLFGATFSYEHDDYGDLRSARFWPYDALGAAEADKQMGVQEEITTILRLTPYLNANQLYDKIKGNRAQFMDTLRAMKNANIVGERPGPGTSRQLYLTGG